MGNNQLKKLTTFIDRAVLDKKFESAALLIVQKNQPFIYQSFGKAHLNSVFDLASLTKPLVVGSLMMHALAEKRIDLSHPLKRYFSLAVDSELAEVNIAQLLAHCSGLAAWHPFYDEYALLSPNRAKRAVIKFISESPLSYMPGSKAVYSDLGYILLGNLLENLYQERLDRLAQKKIFQPIGSAAHYPGLKVKESKRLHYIPTEKAPARQEHLEGIVHDDNCRLMGGICGHAGLFGSAYDVHLILAELMRAYKKERSIFDYEMVKLFWKPPKRRFSLPIHEPRGLAWDQKSKKRSSAGDNAPQDSVGHLGFTGTSMWLSPKSQSWIIFLSNRVFYGREPNPMKEFRPHLHRMAWNAMIDAE